MRRGDVNAFVDLQINGKGALGPPAKKKPEVIFPSTGRRNGGMRMRRSAKTNEIRMEIFQIFLPVFDVMPAF